MLLILLEGCSVAGLAGLIFQKQILIGLGLVGGLIGATAVGLVCKGGSVGNSVSPRTVDNIRKAYEARLKVLEGQFNAQKAELISSCQALLKELEAREAELNKRENALKERGA